MVLHWTHWGLYLKNVFVFALEDTFLTRLPQLVANYIIQCTYLSYVELLNHNILSYYHYKHTEQNFEHIIYITKNTPNLVAKILATKFGFVADWW